MSEPERPYIRGDHPAPPRPETPKERLLGSIPRPGSAKFAPENARAARGKESAGRRTFVFGAPEADGGVNQTPVQARAGGNVQSTVPRRRLHVGGMGSFAGEFGPEGIEGERELFQPSSANTGNVLDTIRSLRRDGNRRAASAGRQPPRPPSSTFSSSGRRGGGGRRAGSARTAREDEGRYLASLRAEHGLPADTHAPWWGSDPLNNNGSNSYGNGNDGNYGTSGGEDGARLYCSSVHRSTPAKAALEASISRATGAAPPVSQRARRALRARMGSSAGHGLGHGAVDPRVAEESRAMDATERRAFDPQVDIPLRPPPHPSTNFISHHSGGLPPLLAIQSGRVPLPAEDEDLVTATDLIEGNHQHFIDNLVSAGLDAPTVIDNVLCDGSSLKSQSLQKRLAKISSERREAGWDPSTVADRGIISGYNALDDKGCSFVESRSVLRNAESQGAVEARQRVELVKRIGKREAYERSIREEMGRRKGKRRAFRNCPQVDFAQVYAEILRVSGPGEGDVGNGGPPGKQRGMFGDPMGNNDDNGNGNGNGDGNDDDDDDGGSRGDLQKACERAARRLERAWSILRVPNLYRAQFRNRHMRQATPGNYAALLSQISDMLLYRRQIETIAELLHERASVLAEIDAVLEEVGVAPSADPHAPSASAAALAATSKHGYAPRSSTSHNADANANGYGYGSTKASPRSMKMNMNMIPTKPYDNDNNDNAPVDRFGHNGNGGGVVLTNPDSLRDELKALGSAVVREVSAWRRGWPWCRSFVYQGREVVSAVKEEEASVAAAFGNRRAFVVASGQPRPISAFGSRAADAAGNGRGRHGDNYYYGDNGGGEGDIYNDDDDDNDDDVGNNGYDRDRNYSGDGRQRRGNGLWAGPLGTGIGESMISSLHGPHTRGAGGVGGGFVPRGARPGSAVSSAGSDASVEITHEMLVAQAAATVKRDIDRQSRILQRRKV